MKVPLIIAYDGLEKSQWIEELVRRHAQKLERFSGRVTACRVTISRPHQHKRAGLLYCVRVDLTVPDAELMVNRDGDFDHSHEDLAVALRDTFDAARRMLQDHVREIRQDVKGHTRNKLGASAADV